MVLKKKYRQVSLDLSLPQQVGSPTSITTPDLPVSPLREPPPYRPPPPAPLSPTANNSQVSPGEDRTTAISERGEVGRNDNSEYGATDNLELGASVSSPPVPPRRKSQDKLKLENKENIEKNTRGSSEAVIKVRFSQIVLCARRKVMSRCSLQLTQYYKSRRMFMISSHILSCNAETVNHVCVCNVFK